LVRPVDFSRTVRVMLVGSAPEPMNSIVRVPSPAHWLEWQDWADPILQQPYTIQDGHLHIPDVPGVGIEWNNDAIAAHQT
jgi:mandelate racemase